MVIVKINVTGTVFKVDSDVFNGSKQVTSLQGKLPRMVADAANNGSTLSLQRPVTSFVAILEYYQIGELHMPTDCCPASFSKEMDFWEIREQTLQECCRIKYRSLMEEQSLLRAFGQEIRSNMAAGNSVTKSSSLKQKLWNIVDNRGTSVLAKIYFGVILVAVITSILGITLGTDQCCTRESTMCEMIEYIGLTDRRLFNLLKEHANVRRCQQTMFDDGYIELPRSVQITEDNRFYYISFSDFVPPPPLSDDSPPDNNSSPPPNNDNSPPPNNDNSPPLNINSSPPPDNDNSPPPDNINNSPPPDNINNSPPPNNNSSPPPNNNSSPPPDNDNSPPPDNDNSPPPDNDNSPSNSEEITYKVRKQYLKDDWIRFIEYITLAFFTADWILRIGVCPSLLQFMKSLLNIIDLAALVGCYLSIMITNVDKNQKYKTNWIDLLDYIQVFRALRLFRLVKNIRTSQVLAFSIRHNMKNVSMLLIFLLIFVCTFGTMVFFAEDGHTVNSILEGWWWSIVTLTTVGYGDIVPQTPIGRAVGSLCAITGIWLLSMTLPIFVNDFVCLHHYPLYENDDDKQEPEVAGKIVSASQTKASVQPIYGEKVKDAWTTLSDGNK